MWPSLMWPPGIITAPTFPRGSSRLILALQTLSNLRALARAALSRALRSRPSGLTLPLVLCLSPPCPAVSQEGFLGEGQGAKA